MSSDRSHNLAIIYPAGTAGPYRIPQFNYILKKMNGHVYFEKAFREGYPYWTAESGEKTIKEMNFDYTFLKCFKAGFLKIYPNLMNCLLRQRPDIVVV